MPGRSIEISMQPAYRKFNYLYIPAQYTTFFPPGEPKTKFPIQIESNADLLNAELQYNSKAHVWFLKLRDWFQSNPNLKAGEKIKITEIESGKRYSLEIGKWGKVLFTTDKEKQSGFIFPSLRA